MNIDWSKAPEGATHATKEDSSWYRNNNGTWYFYHESNRGWVLSGCSEEWREVHLIARPAVVAWRGPQDGLPPVGTICWLSMCMNQGDNVQITYIGDGVFCYKKQHTGKEFSGLTASALFRPIRSERDKVIDEMVAISIQKGNSLTRRELVEVLYDAGYRKGVVR
jgi:hypothetical protein